MGVISCHQHLLHHKFRRTCIDFWTSAVLQHPSTTCRGYKPWRKEPKQVESHIALVGKENLVQKTLFCQEFKICNTKYCTADGNRPWKVLNWCNFLLLYVSVHLAEPQAPFQVSACTFKTPIQLIIRMVIHFATHETHPMRASLFPLQDVSSSEEQVFHFNTNTWYMHWSLESEGFCPLFLVIKNNLLEPVFATQEYKLIYCIPLWTKNHYCHS